MSIKKNAISNFALQVSGIVLPLITFPYITRVLSVTGYGTITFTDAFTQYFLIFSALGIPYYGVREVARRRAAGGNVSMVVKELLILNVFLSLFFSCLFIAIAFFIPTLRSNFWLVLFGCGTVLSNSFLIEWYYQGSEKFTYITVRSIIIKLVFVSAVLFFIKKENDYVLYALLSFLTVFINAIINISYFLNHSDRNNTPFVVKKAISHVKPLLVLFSINISISVYTVLDTIILGLFTDPDKVSLYAVPLRLVKMYWTLIGAIGVVLIPKVTDLFIKKDFDAIAGLLQKSMSIVLLLSVPFCFYCLVFPADILTLISGKKYLEATVVLRILSAVPLIIGICNVCGTQFLLSAGLEKKILHATIFGLIVSLAFNLVFDKFLQEKGAAIACVLAETTVCVYICKEAIKRIKLTPDYSLLAQILVSLLCAAAFIGLAEHYLSSMIVLFASAFVYAFVFITSQFLYFRNDFIFSLLRVRGSNL